MTLVSKGLSVVNQDWVPKAGFIMGLAALVWSGAVSYGGAGAQTTEALKSLSVQVGSVDAKLNGFDNRLTDLNARYTAQAQRIEGWEGRLDSSRNIVAKEIGDLRAIVARNSDMMTQLIEKFSGFLETRRMIVEESTRTHTNQETRLQALESERLSFARLEQRMGALEKLIDSRLPERHNGGGSR